MTSVPCNGCRACCIGERVVLTDEEATRFPYETLGNMKLLSHKPGTNECIYLSDTGCSIHGSAPAICQQFDCRTYFLSMTRKERRIQEKYDNQNNYQQKTIVFEEGRKRVDTLEPWQRHVVLAGRKFEPKTKNRQKLYLYKKNW